MDNMQRKKFNKFLFYSLFFVGIGIDMTLDINYSFTFLLSLWGEIFLLNNYKNFSKHFIVLTLVIGPLVMGIILNFIKSIL